MKLQTILISLAHPSHPPGNNFQGSIPEFPSGSPLTLLDLSGSGISGDMVEALTGSIPSSIKNAKGLIYLDVSNNQLKGEQRKSRSC